MIYKTCIFLVLFLFCRAILVKNAIKPIRVALSVDDNSFKDIIILVNSVIETAIEPEDVVFHFVAVARDILAANVLKKSISKSLENCLPGLKYEIVAFTLPSNSGFALQLNSEKKKSHWNSQSGADMVRFFLPSLFPLTDRLLYLDNDIIVSCCLEEIWETVFDANQIVGIALDDLNWATVTQFKRHYNASHPLVIKNMRRDQSDEYQKLHLGEAITTEEFSRALPRYPNDGVLLIDVQRYNQFKIVDIMNEIALANGKGDYVVNLGTQQFTVLALYDRWKELTPRANLRHFPDMARGYLMWFYYNGFIHYAGQSKPRALCTSTTPENAASRLPYLRAMSYTAWALSNYQVAHKCPHDHVAYLAECVAHMQRANTISEFYSLLQRIISVSKDPSLMYLRIGPLHGNMSLSRYHDWMNNNNNNNNNNRSVEDTSPSSSQLRTQPILGTSKVTQFTVYHSTTQKNHHDGDNSNNEEADHDDIIEIVDRIAFHNSSWSVRVYDHKPQRIEHSRELLVNSAGKSAPVLLPPEPLTAEQAKRKKRQPKKEIVPRTFVVVNKHLCDALTLTALQQKQYQQLLSHTNISASVTANFAISRCDSLLTEIKSEGRRHWDAQAIVIDVNPPHSIGSSSSNRNRKSTSTIDDGKSSGSINSKNNTNNGTSSSSSHLSNTFSTRHSSLGVLLHLDLVFMQPKVILVRLASPADRAASDTDTAVRHLQRHGYLTGVHRGGDDCGASRIAKPASSSSLMLIQFVCLWGVRMNAFEFYPGLL